MPIFPDQKTYEDYYSLERRLEREAQFEAERIKLIAIAQELYDAGDYGGARSVLFDGGIDGDGIALYFELWR